MSDTFPAATCMLLSNSGWWPAWKRHVFYALADASLVVSSDLNKGGTWTGAVEQLDKLKFVPVYVRSTGGSSPGLDALRSKGALPWPNPEDADALESVFEVAAPAAVPSPQSGLALFSGDGTTVVAPSTPSVAEPQPAIEAPSASAPPPAEAPSSEPVEPMPEPAALVSPPSEVPPEPASQTVSAPATPADALFAAVREAITLLLKAPMKDAEVAAALDVSTAQAKAWLQRLVDEGVIEKQKKPAGYIVKQSRLFE